MKRASAKYVPWAVGAVGAAIIGYYALRPSRRRERPAWYKACLANWQAARQADPLLASCYPDPDQLPRLVARLCEATAKGEPPEVSTTQELQLRLLQRCL